MPATSFDRMPDDARLWVFAAAHPLAPDQAEALLARVDGFLERWAAHGAPVLGARDLRHGQFLLIAADERATGVSGCSIDSLFHTLGEVEETIGTELRRTASLVLWRDAEGAVRSADRAEFRRLAQGGAVAEGHVGSATPSPPGTCAGDVGAALPRRVAREGVSSAPRRP